MKRCWNKIALGLFALLLFFQLPACAGDCSGPDDCAAIPDNGTRAAVGGALVCGILLYSRSQRRKAGQAAQGAPSPEEQDPRFGTGEQNANQ
jgi:hypothetical protein